MKVGDECVAIIDGALRFAEITRSAYPTGGVEVRYSTSHGDKLVEVLMAQLLTKEELSRWCTQYKPSTGPAVAPADITLIPTVTQAVGTGMKFSGVRDSFSTGATRDKSAGKGRPDLIPAYSLWRVSRWYEDGGINHGDDNWRTGIPLRRFLLSIFRHLLKIMAGNKDEDHASAIAWNALGYIWTEEAIKQGKVPAEFAKMPIDLEIPDVVPAPAHQETPK